MDPSGHKSLGFELDDLLLATTPLTKEGEKLNILGPITRARHARIEIDTSKSVRGVGRRVWVQIFSEKEIVCEKHAC
eukprot:scaffold6175_cov153-Amphora_coffeaeformis.AAC.1